MSGPHVRPGRSDERGSATVWVLVVTSLVGVMGAGALLLAVAVVARHRAATAADLGALAGAERAVLGDPAACTLAARIAAADGAAVDGCSVEPGGVVELRVSVPVELGPLGRRTARARSRAGPAADPLPPAAGPALPPP